MLTTLAQQDPDEQPNDKARAAAPLPSRTQQTALQIGTLLQATAMLSPLLAVEYDDNDTRSLIPAKTEVNIAAENTIIKICERIDTIIEDKERWSLDKLRSLEDALFAVYNGHVDLLKAQKIAVESVHAPHKHAGVKLCRLADHSLWAAVLGDPKTPDCIVGIGETPAEALKAFDEEFTKKPTKQNEQTEPSVDSSRPATPQKPARRGRQLGQHIKPPGPDTDGLSPQA